MRKLCVLLAVLLMLGLLAGCTRAECDFCGKMAFCEEEEMLGKTVYICGDCTNELEALGDKLEDAGDALGDLTNSMGDALQDFADSFK